MELKKNNNISVILLLLLVYVSEDILVFGTLNNSVVTSFRYIVQAVVFFYIILMHRISEINNRNVLIGLILISLVFISALVNQDFRMGYVFFAFLFVLCILTKEIVSTKNILEVLYKSMVFISLWSLLIYSLCFIVPSLFPIFPIVKNVSGQSFYFCLFSNTSIYFNDFLRNHGPFREPGVFQMYIILSLMYGLFIREKPCFKAIVVLLLALFTTFSTTAYISAILIFFALLCDSRPDKISFNISVICFFILSIAYMAIFTDLLYKEGYGSVFGKMFGTYESNSMNARLASVWVNFKILKENILFGKGITDVGEFFSSYAYEMFGFRVRDNTNGILIMYARFGLLFGSIYLYRIISFCFKYFSKHLFVKVLLSASVIVLYFGETTSYSFLFTIILFDDNKTNGELSYEHS